MPTLIDLASLISISILQMFISNFQYCLYFPITQEVVCSDTGMVQYQKCVVREVANTKPFRFWCKKYSRSTLKRPEQIDWV